MGKITWNKTSSVGSTNNINKPSQMSDRRSKIMSQTKVESQNLRIMKLAGFELVGIKVAQ